MTYNFNKIIDRKKTNSAKYEMTKAVFGTDDILPMWVADMDFETPDFIVNAIQKRTNHHLFGYSSKPDSFYDSIINWMKKRHNWNVKREWITSSPGVVPALNLSVLAFTNPNDKIIIQPPVYHLFASAVKDNNRTLINNQLKLENGKYEIDFDDLENKIKDDIKMLIFCNPHNPVGAVWNKKDLLRLGNLCLENDVLLVSDEIHSDLVFDQKHIPIASLSPEIANNTITCMAPSKTFNLAGLSTSEIIISNEEIREKFNHLLHNLHIHYGNIFGNIALESAYTYGEEWLEQLLKYLKNNIDFLVEYFEKYIPKIKVIIPDATYLIWLDCRELNLSDDELKKFFIKDVKIGLNDGISFGPGGEGFQRINIAYPKSIIEKAVERIKNVMNDKF
ncbi:MAG: PatB family C-S lyase [Candidatus Marinimicrobia bacterium]|nr:PatB family C-S lyase [Candidatus Neomarinimicrobiota bacterium]